MSDPQIPEHQTRELYHNIEQLIREVRLCKSLENFYRAQQHLGEHIERTAELIRATNERIGKDKARLRKLHQKNFYETRAEAAALNVAIEKAKLEHDAYYLLAREYRMVGDALAWKVYGFQTLPIYAYGLNSCPGINASSRQAGDEAEKEEIEKLWSEEGAFALRHDYTNCLRVGDLSVLYPGSHILEILEVKVEGREVGRSQKEMGRRAVDLTERGKATMPNGRLLIGRNYAVEPPDAVIQTNLTLLTQAISQARENTIGRAANQYLAITVVDNTNPAKRTRDEVLKEWEELAGGFIPPDIWPLWPEDILQSSSYQKLTKPGFSAPYTIYPLPPDFAAGLVTGHLEVHYRLNTAAVVQAFRDAGFEAECLIGKWRERGESPPKKLQGPYFRVGKGTWHFLVPDIPIEHVLFDGLPLEELVASISAFYEDELKQDSSELLSAIIREPDGRRHLHSILTYSSLEEVWRASEEFI